MVYTATFKPSFLKDLKKLPKNIRLRCQIAVERIIEEPFDVGAKRLAGYTQVYRYRIGEYRLAYYVYSKEKKIVFLLVAHRNDIYRHLKLTH